MLMFDHIPSKMIRQVMMLVIILGLGFVLFSELHFLLGGFMGAIAMYVLLRRPMFILVYHRKWKRYLATLLLLTLSLVVIVYPLAWVVNRLIDELAPMLADTSKLEASLASIDEYLKSKYHFDILSEANMQKIPAAVTTLGTKIISATLNGLTNLVFMYFLLWFMLNHCGELERWVRTHLPFKNINVARVMKETHDVVLSNTIGIPVLGAVQGIVAMLGYYMFDVEKPILWGIITGITSVIPFVGTMAAWVPITIFSFAKGDTTNGYWLALWGLFVIGGSDNIFRMVLQKYLADIHPIITVLGVIVGLALFGFLGLIFGPLLVSLFLLLMRIYGDEFVKDEAGHQEPPPPNASPELPNPG